MTELKELVKQVNQDVSLRGKELKKGVKDVASLLVITSYKLIHLNSRDTLFAMYIVRNTKKTKNLNKHSNCYLN